ALVFQSVDIEKITGTLKQIDLRIFFLSFLVYLGNKLVASYRWKILLRAQDIEVGLLTLYKVNLFGMVINSFMPSTIGGESVRIYWLARKFPKNKAASIIATLTDKLLGVVALVFLVFVSLPFNSLVEDQIKLIGTVILGIILAFIGVLVWSPRNWTPVFLRKLMFNSWLQSKYDQTLSILKIYKHSKGVLLSTFLLAILFQTISVANQFLRFKSIGVDVPIQHLILAIPIITLIVTIPISIGGFGLRELSLIGLLGPIGVETHEIVSYTFVGYFSVLLLSIGLAIYNIFDEPFRNTWRESLSADQSPYSETNHK
ncbi:MAG: flippase-like domain-containing protein, partial [Chloroflexota bacterium]